MATTDDTGANTGVDISTIPAAGGIQNPQEVTPPAATAKPEDGADQGTETPAEGQEGDKGSAEDINPDTGHPYTAEEWRDQFRASAKGANELLEANKTLELEIAKVREDDDKTLKEKETEIATLRTLAEGKNPDGLSLHDLRKKYDEVAGKLAHNERNTALDTFLASTKIDGAPSFKETLRALAQANPATPLATLWDNNLKAGAEAAAAAKKAADTTRRGSAPDSGKGTTSRESKGETVANTGLSTAEFNALSVAKRRDLLTKAGY